MGKSQQQTKQTGQDRHKQTELTNQRTGLSSVYKVIFIALCCPILLFTVVGMIAPQQTTHAMNGAPTMMPSITITIIPPTPSPTLTPSPTPSLTPTPSPTPTPTNTPAPTPTKAPTATPQPHVTPTQQPVPTATAASSNQIPPFATPPPYTVATVIVGPSPTPTPEPTATSINGSGLPSSTPTTGLTPGSGNDQNSTSPDNGTSSNTTAQHPPFLVLGTLVGGLLLLLVVAIFLVRKLLDPLRDDMNMPPSGARPWSRTPSASMDGATDLYSWGNAATSGQAWANDPFAETNPPPLATTAQPQPNDGMWLPQNPMMEANNAWDIIPATANGQPVWHGDNGGNTANPLFANQNPSFTDPNSNGFPVTPDPLPATGTQWGMLPGDISIPVYAQNNGMPPIMPPNTNFPTMPPMPPTPGYQGQYFAGDPSYNEDQPPLNSFEDR